MRISASNATKRKHITEVTAYGSNLPLITASGEINGHNKVELRKNILALATTMGSGQYDDSGIDGVEVATAADRRAALEEAWDNPNNGSWTELGNGIAQQIDVRLDREGFMRSLFVKAELAQGAVPRIRVREHNVHVFMSRGVGEVFPQYVRDKYVVADEFHINAAPHIDEREIYQGSADNLQDKYFEGLEAIMVGEDRTAKRLLDSTVGVFNDAYYWSGELNQKTFVAAKTRLESWLLPTAMCLMSHDLTNDILVGTDFSTFFEPVTKYEILRTGRIGTLFGATLVTDGFREPNLRVLNDGELYFTTTPEFLGAYTDRYGVRSEPSDLFQQGINARGWRFSELISEVLANAKGVVKAQRIS